MLHIKASNINSENFKKLKEFMKSAGSIAWEFEGDYEILKITFKDNASALKAFHKSDASSLEVSAFGAVTVEKGTIIVELNSDAHNALSSSSLSEDTSHNYSTSEVLVRFKTSIDISKVKALVNKFDPYASMIGNMDKWRTANRLNSEVIEDLREMGCYLFKIKNFVYPDGSKRDWMVIKTEDGE